MDFYPRGAQTFDGMQCRVCEGEVDARQPVYGDIDADFVDGGYQFRGSVACKGCYEALLKAESETWLRAANLARHRGQDALADAYMKGSVDTLARMRAA